MENSLWVKNRKSFSSFTIIIQHTALVVDHIFITNEKVMTKYFDNNNTINFFNIIQIVIFSVSVK